MYINTTTTQHKKNINVELNLKVIYEAATEIRRLYLSTDLSNWEVWQGDAFILRGIFF